jgi:hypothetical protein
MMRIAQLMFAALCLAATVGCGGADAADTTLRYASPDNPDDTLVIEADSDGRMRVEDSHGRMVILRDGERYVVFSPPSGGRAATRLDDYMAVGAELRERMVRSGAMTGESDDTRYAVRQEGARTIGSWQGTVYSIDPVEAPGVSQEIVISDDPALADVRHVAVTALEAFEQPSRAVLVFPQAFDRLTTETLARGMPVSFNGLDLQTISRDPVAADRFELQESVLSRDQLRDLMMR